MTAPATCPAVQRALDEAFVAGLLPRPDTILHLETCPSCRTYRERLARIDESLREHPQEGPPPLLGAVAREALGSALLGGAAATGRAATGSAAGPRWPLLLLVAAAASIATVALWPRAPAMGPATGGQFAVRHGQQGSSSLARSPTGLRALCVSDGPTGPVVQPLDDGDAGTDDGPRPRCSVRDRLGLAYRNETARPVYVAVVLRRPDGRTRAVHPELASRPLPPTGPADPEVPLGEPVALEPGEAGRLEVLAHFSPGPVSPGQLQALEQGQPGPAAFRLGLEIRP